MLREVIRHFLNKRGYEIIKQSYIGDPYKEISEGDFLLYKTPIGNYYFPKDARNDGMLKLMSRGRVHDSEVVAIAKKYIKPGTAVLDIGANFGQMSLLFSQATGPAGKVYAFDGQRKVFDALVKTVEANNCSNIICKFGAVYNENGKTLYFPEPNVEEFNPYSANAIDPSLSTGHYEVKTFTIDSLNIPEPISFIKIDIQGSDIFALQGAKETILKNRMPIIFEYEDEFQDQFGKNFQDYVEFVNEIGYKFGDIVLKNNFLILPK